MINATNLRIRMKGDENLYTLTPLEIEADCPDAPPMKFENITYTFDCKIVSTTVASSDGKRLTIPAELQGNG